MEPPDQYNAELGVLVHALISADNAAKVAAPLRPAAVLADAPPASFIARPATLPPPAAHSTASIWRLQRPTNTTPRSGDCTHSLKKAKPRSSTVSPHTSSTPAEREP